MTAGDGPLVVTSLEDFFFFLARHGMLKNHVVYGVNRTGEDGARGY